MKYAMIGLGRMGAAMARRSALAGHEVVGFDTGEMAREAFIQSADGLEVTESLEDLVDSLPSPKVVWVMLPAGKATSDTISALAALLGHGDVVIEGGNTDFDFSLGYSSELQARGISYIDAGVSGDLFGEKAGYCLMVGGTREVVSLVEQLFYDLAPARGYLHAGGVGSGHYVKMVHNGIEYGMMQSIAEGFELLERNSHFDLDLYAVAEMFRNGSVIRSWLMDLTATSLAPGSGFEEIEGLVDDSGEGRWTLREAINEAVPLPSITAALFARYYSKDVNSYQARLTAATRNQFGGHPLHKRVEDS